MIRYCTAALAAVLCWSAYADGPAARTYPLSRHGTLEMKAPSSWKDFVRRPPNDLPPTITFGAGAGAPFEVIVTPIWPMRPDIKAPTLPELKANVREAADSVAAQAVEKRIAVRELKSGASVIGYYYTVTDKAPKPGEFKLMTQGMFGLVDLRVSFTILTNEGQEGTVKEALAMLSSASLR
jgi:hypothetical protein